MTRLSYLLACLAPLFGSCSSGTEHNQPTEHGPPLPRLYLESPRQTASAPDTIYPGKPYARKVFLNSGALQKLATQSNYPYLVRAKAFVEDQPNMALESTCVADTCYLKIDPSKVPGKPSSIIWRCLVSIDYQDNGKATDTTFAIREIVIVGK